jgi:GNAT superfamily N-acetyltransferase
MNAGFVTEAPPLRQGVHELAPGHIATIVTWLELMQPPRPGAGNRATPHLERVSGRDAPRHCAMFRRIGERWIWTSRLLMSDDELRATLDRSDIRSHIVTADGRDIGLFELRMDDCEAELTFLGLDQDATGRGIGTDLVERAWQMTLSEGLNRLIVHTCHFDDPRALGFYRQRGFKPFKQAVEVMPDPRLSGVLSPQAGPHIPLTG